METEDFIIPIIAILAIILVVVGTVSLVYVVEKKCCKEVSNNMNLKHKYTLWTECMVYDNGWIQLERYRQVKDLQ